MSVRIDRDAENRRWTRLTGRLHYIDPERRRMNDQWRALLLPLLWLAALILTVWYLVTHPLGRRGDPN